MTEKIFSYGTLQQDEVQIAIFGRNLRGKADVLIGYELKNLDRTCAHATAVSGKTTHPVLERTNNPLDKISGSVFEVTSEELDAADQYEKPDYERASVQLASDTTAWVYVRASS
jgi:gamma-glutamylcyclotransferase (GGCT)/AIG2-like uncharacterized protein YtfP